jgi:CMP-2-keto-3-deoxyoctulosonic acid synthetase
VRYVSLERSKLELERNLEQLRALENNISIHVGYINSSPLSVDTKNDLIEVKKIMKNNE